MRAPRTPPGGGRSRRRAARNSFATTVRPQAWVHLGCGGPAGRGAADFAVAGRPTGSPSRRSLVAARALKGSARSWSNGWCHPFLSRRSQASSGLPGAFWTRLDFGAARPRLCAPPDPALNKLPHCPLTCPACPSHTGDRFILTGRHQSRLVTEVDGRQRAQMPRGLHPPLERQRRLLAARGQVESRAHAIASHSAECGIVGARALPTHLQLRNSAPVARISRVAPREAFDPRVAHCCRSLNRPLPAN